MIRRIKAGKAKSQENPNIQDMVSALRDGPRSALAVYRSFSERQYQHMKSVMDSLEPYLPVEIVASWKVLEAMHDELAT